LVFERHLPERVTLPDHPPRLGAKVVLRDNSQSPTFEVAGVEAETLTVRMIRHGDGAVLSEEEAAAVQLEVLPRDELIVIADFGEAIFPGLLPLGSVDQGGGKPVHIVI